MATQTSPSGLPLGPPRTAIYDCSYSNEVCYIVLMSRCTRFNISLSKSNLGTNNPHLQAYTDFLARLNPDDEFEDLDDETDFQDWMLEPCMPHFQSLPEKKSDVTLEEFFGGPRKQLRVYVDDGGELKAKQVFGEPFGMYVDGYDTYSLRSFPIENNSYPNLLRVKASDIKILPELLDENDDQDPACDPPTRVMLPNGSIKKLKHPPGMVGLRTELDVATRMLENSLYSNRDVHVPAFHSIVMAEDEGNGSYGFLIDWIPPFPTLLSCLSNLHDPILLALSRHHDKWGAQVQATLQVLHSHNIIWGGVGRSNVYIDDQNDAWVCGFGGGYEIGLLDSSKGWSKEGDLQGLRNIFLRCLKGLEPVAEDNMDRPWRDRDGHTEGDGDEFSEAESCDSFGGD